MQYEVLNAKETDLCNPGAQSCQIAQGRGQGKKVVRRRCLLCSSVAQAKGSTGISGRLGLGVPFYEYYGNGGGGACFSADRHGAGAYQATLDLCLGKTAHCTQRCRELMAEIHNFWAFPSCCSSEAGRLLLNTEVPGYLGT